MEYDPERNGVLDRHTGDFIPYGDNDLLPYEHRRIREDYLFAKNLSEQDSNVRSRKEETKDVDIMQYLDTTPSRVESTRETSPRKVHPLGDVLYQILGGKDNATRERDAAEALEEQRLEKLRTAMESSVSPGRIDESTLLARALQNMEFQMVEESRREEAFDRDFDEKEYKASYCKRQMLTLSTAICIAQVGLLLPFFSLINLLLLNIECFYVCVLLSCIPMNIHEISNV